MNIRQTFAAEWILRLDDAILDLDVNDGCGADCARVIRAAIAFLEACPDIAFDGEAEERVICAAIVQCETFYFG